jgi:sugar phosphate isomerase/epimerase
MKKKIGVQLYSVRDELGKDFDGVIAKIAKMGYDGVELAGLPAGVTPEKAVNLFKSLGLGLSSGHMALPIGENKNKTIDDAKALGITTIVGGKGPDDFKTLDLVKKTCEIFNEAGKNAKDAGLRLAIHNHWWEFVKLDGRLVFDIMLEHLDPCVFFEIDTYWVKTGGADPATVIKELGNRAPLIHIKDGVCKIGAYPMTAVGKGIIDFKPIFKSAEFAEWYIVELDSCATDMLTAVKESLEYLKTVVK